MVSSFYRGKEFFSSAFFSKVGSKIKYSSKSSTCEKQKIEKIHVKENNHTHKTIFTWFGNLQGFHYYQGKYKVWLQCFNLSKDDHNNNKTLITKIGFFLHHTHRIHYRLQNGPKIFLGVSAWACWPKPPLHGLSLSKSLIKNHTTLFG